MLLPSYASDAEYRRTVTRTIDCRFSDAAVHRLDIADALVPLSQYKHFYLLGIAIQRHDSTLFINQT